MSILQADSIIKTEKGRKILQDISLSCSTGEILGFLGRNGSGKSTLFKIMAGVTGAETKFLKIDGKLVKTVSDRKGLITYLPQGDFLPNHVKIKELIKISTNAENSQKLSQHPFIKPFLNATSKTLSGGEKRVVEILLVLFADSKFILLDEPFQSLSPIIIEEIKKLIGSESRHKGIIITDHQYQNVLDISDSVILLKEGCTFIIKDTKDLQFHRYLNF